MAKPWASPEAKLWEVRAAASLAGSGRDHGQCTDGCDLPAPVCGWFTEGFDTPDLKEAKALLDGSMGSRASLSVSNLVLLIP
jgi:hypothetical protein